MNGRALTLLALTVLAAGCSSGTTVTAGPGSATAPATSAPATSATSATGSNTPLPSTGSPTATGMCRIIDLATASTLLGGTPKQTSISSSAGSGAVKIDGCSYTGTDPSLGYDVNRHPGADAKVFVTAASAQMGKQPGVKVFTVPLGDAALGFTVAVGARTMARIEVAKGELTIAVNCVGTDAAKAKSVALEAAKRLVDSV